MNIAIYPGSFNPWHEGHDDVLAKALNIFDKIVIAVGRNPDKPARNDKDLNILWGQVVHAIGVEESDRIQVVEFEGTLADFVNEYVDLEDAVTEFPTSYDACAVIRGLRNGQDFEFEKTQQYWNEDLGLKVPTVYLISDRKLTHISSSAKRAVAKIKGG